MFKLLASIFNSLIPFASAINNLGVASEEASQVVRLKAEAYRLDEEHNINLAIEQRKKELPSPD